MQNDIPNVPWYITAQDYDQWQIYMSEMQETEEGTDEREEYVELIRSLPTYPPGIDSDNTHIWVILTTHTVN